MNQPDNNEKQAAPAPATKKTWLKRIGVAGFLFFLIKGIVWLFIFYGGFRLSGC